MKLYGTGNPAKISAMRQRLKELDIELTGLEDMKEQGAMRYQLHRRNGSTPLENARQKALAYYKAFHMPVFSCDSGLYFDNVPDEIREHGVHVRTINGKYLSDEEMLAYYTGLVKKYGPLTARYKNAICFVKDENSIYEAMDEAMESEKFILTDAPHSRIKKKGFPLDSISIDIKTGQYYYNLSMEQLDKVAVEDGFLSFFKELKESIVTICTDFTVHNQMHAICAYLHITSVHKTTYRYNDYKNKINLVYKMVTFA